jgi:integrase
MSREWLLPRNDWATVRILAILRTRDSDRPAEIMARAALLVVAPNTLNRTVVPRRLRNSALRTREYLTPGEVAKLMEAARKNRHGHRDATMIMVAHRHGLRVSELIDLRWDQVDWTAATLHVRRAKNGLPSVHPIRGDELRALRRLHRDSPASPFIFVSERGVPFGTAGVARMLERAGQAAGLGFKVHPHMLRHACGFKLANDGHDTRSLQAYLGHRNIQHTVRYTDLAPERFKDFWRD